MNRTILIAVLVLAGTALTAAPSRAQLRLDAVGTKAQARALRLLKAADGLERMGELKKAAPAYDHIIKLDDPLGEFPDVRAMAGMRLSVIFLQTGNYENAKRVLQAVADIPGVSPDLLATIHRNIDKMGKGP